MYFYHVKKKEAEREQYLLCKENHYFLFPVDLGWTVYE